MKKLPIIGLLIGAVVGVVSILMRRKKTRPGQQDTGSTM